MALPVMATPISISKAYSPGHVTGFFEKVSGSVLTEGFSASLGFLRPTLHHTTSRFQVIHPVAMRYQSGLYGTFWI